MNKSLMLALEARNREMAEEIKAAKKAAFMPPGYPGTLADFITNEVWPAPRTEDIVTIQRLVGELKALKEKQ